MIGAIAKNSDYSSKDNKEIISASLSGSLVTELLTESAKHNLSRSEIVEFALRKLFKMPVDSCKRALTNIYEQTPELAA